MSSLIQNSVIVLGLLAIVGLGYYLYAQNSSSTLDQNTRVSNQVAIETAEFLRRLNELKAMELGTEIFSDPRFASLEYTTTPPPSEPVGRVNPFNITSR